MAEIDYTDAVDKGKVFTSNVAKVLRGLLDGAERGATIALENLRPLAEQADAFFGNDDELVPAVPEGGVPVDEELEDDATAAQVAGVVSS